jgi:hypothetical protein
MSNSKKGNTMNSPFKPPQSKTPDIYLSGEAVNAIILALNTPTILAKASDGSMRPFIDPSPIGNIIFSALQAVGVEPEQVQSN